MAGRFDLQLAREAPPVDSETIVDRAPMLSTSFLAFNVGLAPMEDERVRRAITHAIDRGAGGFPASITPPAAAARSRP